MAQLNTIAAKEAIYAGRAVRSSDATPSAQGWLRKEAAAGRIAKLSGVVGWCPAHSRWTFYVSANRAPEFKRECRRDYGRMIDAAAVDEARRGHFESASELTSLANEWREAA